jgi:hypothetical protein
VVAPEDEAPSANLGAVKGLETLAVLDLTPLVDLAAADLAGGGCELACGCCDGCCDLLVWCCDLAGGCCDLAGGVTSASLLDLAGA